LGPQNLGCISHSKMKNIPTEASPIYGHTGPYGGRKARMVSVRQSICIFKRPESNATMCRLQPDPTENGSDNHDQIRFAVTGLRLQNALNSGCTQPTCSGRRNVTHTARRINDDNVIVPGIVEKNRVRRDKNGDRLRRRPRFKSIDTHLPSGAGAPNCFAHHFGAAQPRNRPGRFSWIKRNVKFPLADRAIVCAPLQRACP